MIKGKTKVLLEVTDFSESVQGAIDDVLDIGCYKIYVKG